MCGIAGIYNFDSQSVDQKMLERMTHVLAHRGPDDEGVFCNRHVGLGNTRLSILDLSPKGHQPMADESGETWIVYNGEIYNFSEIKETLIKRGYRFRSRSDTETVLHAYREYGKDCLSLFNGMFAFAIWDARQGRLFLARDRLGIKPLYYFHDTRRFVFASELRSIVASGLVPKEINGQAVHDFLTLGYVLEPWTIYEGIVALPPAHWMVVDAGGVASGPYWEIPPPREPDGSRSLEEHAWEIRALLEDSIGLQQVSDVPLGVFLSGGTDSTSVAALMACSVSQPIKTFTLASQHPWMDESGRARLVARRYDTDHRECRVTANDVLESLLPLTWAMNQPMADLFETYFIAKLAAQEVKVALSGAGGDELFAGYHQTRWHFSLLHPLAALCPEPLTRLLRRWDNRSGLLKTSLRVIDISRAPTHLERQLRSYAYQDTDKRALYAAGFLADYGPVPTEEYLHRLFYQPDTGDVVARYMLFDLKNYLQSYILPATDNGGMAHSLEIRVPFLDHRLVELAAEIPSQQKFRHGATKVVLRRAVQDLLPEEVLKGPKKGFGAPRQDFVRHELKPVVFSLLSPASVKRRDWFCVEPVQAVLHDYYDCKPTRQLWSDFQRLWSLVTLELWLRVHVDHDFTGPPEVRLEDFLPLESDRR
jgi:asparagine synthase (glutamine-hydrolysing)